VLLHGPVNQLWNREIVPSASLGLIRHKHTHTHTQSTNEEPDTTDLGMGVIIRSTPLKQSHPDRYADKIIVTKYHIIGYQPISNCKQNFSFRHFFLLTVFKIRPISHKKKKKKTALILGGITSDLIIYIIKNYNHVKEGHLYTVEL